MKKLITIFALLFLTVGVFAQTAKVEGTPETLKDNLSHDVLEFIMTSNVTNEEVDNSAQYYTEYFTVDYNSESHKATINFIENSIKSRRVVTRFLLSTGVRSVDFNDKNYTIMEFFSEHLE
jgi:hypothetical protein